MFLLFTVWNALSTRPMTWAILKVSNVHSVACSVPDDMGLIFPGRIVFGVVMSLA